MNPYSISKSINVNVGSKTDCIVLALYRRRLVTEKRMKNVTKTKRKTKIES